MARPTADESGGPAVVAGKVRLPAPDGYRWLTPPMVDDRVNALAQIDDVAAPPPLGAVLANDEGERLKWAEAKLERIRNIARAGEPDEDWDGYSA